MGAAALDGSGLPMPTDTAMEYLRQGLTLSLWDYDDGPAWRYDQPGDADPRAPLMLALVGNGVAVTRGAQA